MADAIWCADGHNRGEHEEALIRTGPTGTP
jgi:hypothetical protein